MKKVLALLLVVAMLLPMSLSVPAKAEEIKKENFYLVAWTDFDETKYPYLNGFITPNFSNRGENTYLSYGGVGLEYGKYTDADVTAMAQALKKTLEARVEGSRYLHFFGPGKLFRLAPENAIFLDFYVGQMAEIVDALMKKLKEIGAPVDGAVVDTEYIGFSVYYLIDTDSDFENLVSNPKLLQNIVKDKRYKERIRPMLEEYGFIFFEHEDPAKQAVYTELYSLTKGAGAKYEKSRLVWNTVMRIHLNRYVDEWCTVPVTRYYPNANVSDYQSIDGKTWMGLNAVDDFGAVITGGNTHKVGNTSTYSYYYTRPEPNAFKNLTTVPGFNEAYYQAEPFTGLLYDINFTRYLYESTDTKRVSPWTSSYYYTYTGEKKASVAMTPYYADLIYHLGMFNPRPFLFYNTKAETERLGGTDGWDKTGLILNDLITELNKLVGYSDREPISTPLNWNSKYVLTGMYANGRNLWRITPNIDVISRGEFLVDEEVPTFFVNGETVTFPGGKILPEADISISGSVGYWVETAKDVMPVVTTDADRYETYPSLQYDFETYDYGAFDYNTSMPTNAWGFTWSKTASGIKGESNIVVIDGNKKLSIIGNAKNWLKTLPGNITAGDTYAEDQAWEITVTIPKDLSKDAEIQLLNYTGTKQELEDGGFKVKDGKVYYASGKYDGDEMPIYEELMAVEPDTTYTFVRYMDFNDKDTFTSTFAVKNKNGRTLKSAENIPAPTFANIDTVGFSVAEADKAVLVDDFKFYLTGTSLDFSLYDFEIGYNVELDTTRDRSTAYRLSWLNATDEEETATVKADITENGKTTTTVVKEITMMPGSDSITTGVVEIKEGQTVKIYLESTVKPIAADDEAGPLVDATFTEGVSEKVPTALKNLGLDTPEKIKEALEGKVNAASADIEKVTCYQLAVNKEDLPKHGKVTVIMPYPAGTDANYTFYGAQLYRMDAYGKKAGDAEALKIVNTAEGIQFEVFGDSPIAIGWTAPAEVVETEPTEAPTRTPNQLERPVGTRITRPTEAPEEEEYEEPTEETEYIEETEPTEAPTEETEEPTETTAPVVEDEGGMNIWLIVVIAAVVLAGAGVAVFFLLKKKPTAPKANEE